jgi:ssDNA-binding Zn-finger/Zn-ribbon topoisomerase 1
MGPRREVRYPVARDCEGSLRWAREEARRPRGARPDYFCWVCGESMVLRAGDIRRPHFAHWPHARAAACGGEGALHRLGRAAAADVIRRGGPLVHICPECRFIAIRPTGFLSPEEEEPVEPWRPDLLLRHRGGGSPFLALEVVVAHPPEPEKIQGLIQRGIPVGILHLEDLRDLDGWRRALPLSALHGQPCPGPWHPMPPEADLRMVVLAGEEPWCRCGRSRERIFVEARRLPAGESALERLGQELQAFLRFGGVDREERWMFGVQGQSSFAAAPDLRFVSLEHVALAAGLSGDEIRRARAALGGRGRLLIQRCPDCRHKRPAEVFRRHAGLDARFFEALRALGLTELPPAPGALALPTGLIQPPDGRLLLMASFRIIREVPVEIRSLPIRAWDGAAWWGRPILHAPPWEAPCGRCGKPLRKKRWLRREKGRAFWLCQDCAEQEEQALGPFQPPELGSIPTP